MNPTDADGDTIKCRWATQWEADSAFYIQSVWPSLSLDQDNCIVHYDGTLDPYGPIADGLKPIALMIEDFDKSGNVKSSTPIQFLAQVWTPDLLSKSAKLSRSQGSGQNTNCWPNCYPEIPEDDDEFEHETGRKSRKAPRAGSTTTTSTTTTSTTWTSTTWTSTPFTVSSVTVEPAYYCDPLIGPVFDDSIVSPDGTEFNVKNGHVDLILAAISEIGIATFTYQGPLGFTCGPVDQNKVIIFQKN